MSSIDLTTLISRAERVLAQLEAWLPPAPPETDWSAQAFRWRKRGARGWLDAVRHVSRIHSQGSAAYRSPERYHRPQYPAFPGGQAGQQRPYDRRPGHGQSSLVKAMLDTYSDQGLRLIEVDKADMADLGDIVDILGRARNASSSSATTSPSKKANPATRRSSRCWTGPSAPPATMSLFTPPRTGATSCRIYERKPGRQASGRRRDPPRRDRRRKDIAFRALPGLWLSFYPFKQDDYLDIVNYWLGVHGCAQADIESFAHRGLAMGAGTRLALGPCGTPRFARDWAARYV